MLDIKGKCAGQGFPSAVMGRMEVDSGAGVASKLPIVRELKRIKLKLKQANKSATSKNESSVLIIKETKAK